MSEWLLALWIALIATDRIDLAGGHGPFILTPFLVLTPIVAASELARRSLNRRPLSVPRSAVAYVALVSLLLAVVLTSTFFSIDETVSASRATLLTAQVFGTFSVVWLASDRPDAMRIFARGAILALPIFIACDVVEVLWWIGRAPEIFRLGTISISFDKLQSTGPIPRLAGAVADGNRTGYVLVCYTAIIAAGETRRNWRRFGVGCAVVLILATISRSATLAALAALAMAMLTTRRRVSIRALAAGAACLVALAGALLYNPGMLDRVSSIANSPLASRVSTSEGSAQGHVELIQRGLGEATQSVQRSLIGLGYGNAYLVLQDMFPSNRYGNFHSLYVTMFAESGVFALLLLLVLLTLPLLSGGPWRPLVVGTIAFNVFYQTAFEPTFWFVLAAAWLAMSGHVFRGFAVRGTPQRRFGHSSV
jgi:hypothetical protein